MAIWSLKLVSLLVFCFCILTTLVCISFAEEQEDSFVLDDNLIAAINNNPASSWKAGRNRVFEGVTKRQVKRFLGSFPLYLSDLATSDIQQQHSPVTEPPPSSFDARTKWPSCIHPIRDQQSCGSCWAFSSSEVFSDRYCIASNGTVNVVLSPQALISCDTQSDGCDGGYETKAWNYFADPGIPTDECYPYTSGGGDTGVCNTTCADSSPFVNFKAKPNSNFVFRNNTEAAQNAILTLGPITASYEVFQDFYSYTSGVYTHISGASDGFHAVKVVGWGHDSDSGLDYWIVANSWGPEWALDGFFWMRRGNNECGFEMEMSGGLPETATKLSISSVPVLTADSVFSLKVEVQNMASFVVNDSSATVNVTVKNQESLLVNGGSKQAVSGTAQYSGLSIRVAGQNYIIEATSDGLTPAQTISFDVIHGNPAVMGVAQQPGGAIAGSKFQIQPRVSMKDAWGNEAQIASGNVTVSISSGYGPEGAELQGVVNVELTGGQAQFSNLRINKAGTYRLHFSFNGTVHVDSLEFQVSTPTIREILILTQPGNSTSGEPLVPPPNIQVKDEFGNFVSDGTKVNVSIASGGDPSVLQGNTTVGTVNGTATFWNLRIDQAGTFTLKFTCSNLTITSNEFMVVDPSFPSQLIILIQPGNSTSGQLLDPQPTIQVKDASGEIVSGEIEVQVSIASGGSQDVLQGNTTVMTVNGNATFSDLRIDQVGVYELNFTCSGLSVFSEEFDVVASAGSGSNSNAASSGSISRPSHVVLAIAFVLCALLSKFLI